MGLTVYQSSRNILLEQASGSLSSYLAESRVLHREAISLRFLVILPDRWDGFSSSLLFLCLACFASSFERDDLVPT